MFGLDAFGVELHPVHWQFAVLQAHDRPIVKFGSNFQTVRKRRALYGEGMVPRGFERGRKTCEQGFSGMVDRAHFTVNDFMAAHDFAAKGLSDCLMAKADAHQRGSGFRSSLRQCQTNARLGRITRPGGQDNAGRSHSHCLLDINRVIAFHHNVRAKFTKIVHQIVGEAVVIIDQEKHRIAAVRFG